MFGFRRGRCADRVEGRAERALHELAVGPPVGHSRADERFGVLTRVTRRDGAKSRGAPLPEGSRLATSPRHAGEIINARNWRIVEDLSVFAAHRGHSLLELAFSWLLRDGVVASVIAGATTPEQVKQNVHAAQWALSPEELAEIDRITHPVG